MKFTALVAAVFTAALTTAAHAVGPAPEPLPEPVTLTIGYVKVGHLSPMLDVASELEKFNVRVERVEFVRYADARTALMSNSVDISAVGPGDLAIAASQGSENLIGLVGAGSSEKYLVVRDGVEIESWDDIAGKRIGIAPGSAVWFQWAMTMIEKGIPYDTFDPVNIQGGGTAFLQAIRRGDIDAMVLWEPFESQAVAEGDAYFAEDVEYSQSKAVGAELGLLAASGEAMANKKEAIRRFLWVYLDAEEKMAEDGALFAESYARYTGLPLEVTGPSAEVIELGGVLTKEQVRLQAEAAFENGVIQKDVADEAAALYDDSMAREILR